MTVIYLCKIITSIMFGLQHSALNMMLLLVFTTVVEIVIYHSIFNIILCQLLLFSLLFNRNIIGIGIEIQECVVSIKKWKLYFIQGSFCIKGIIPEGFISKWLFIRVKGIEMAKPEGCGIYFYQSWGSKTILIWIMRMLFL